MNTYDDDIVFNEFVRIREDNTSKHNTTVKENLKELVGDVAGKKILDLGCGLGEFAKYFTDNNASQVVGIDISKRVIDYALQNNKSNNIEYKQLDIKNLSDITQKFDIIFSDMVFNYIEDFDEMMQNIYNLLNENGILVFSQVHPISTASLSEKSSWIKDEYENLKALIDNYSNVSVRKRMYFGGLFNFYHRRFEEIINISINNNFEIVKILEPYYTEKEFNRL